MEFDLRFSNDPDVSTPYHGGTVDQQLDWPIHDFGARHHDTATS